jgi:hypothetical protein
MVKCAFSADQIAMAVKAGKGAEMRLANNEYSGEGVHEL